MRASTLWQPWASLVAIGVKRFETRNYPPPAKLIEQRIAIHAAVRPIQATWRTLDYATCEAITMAFTKAGIKGDLGQLPHGAVVCTAVLAGAYQCKGFVTEGGVLSVRTERFRHSPTEFPILPVDPFGDFSPGRWLWHLADVQRLPEPVPAKGKQGWWTWDEAAAP